MTTTILGYTVEDVRFPTHLHGDGSDAMNPDPDYSCAYVVLKTNTVITGHGFTFTIGRGTEVVVAAVDAIAPLVVGLEMKKIVDDFAGIYRRLTSETQLRWIGPEKGAVHLAAAAILNAIWDLWAKMEGKPLWKLLVDLSPEKLVSCIDFRYISDFLSKNEAIEILRRNQKEKIERESKIKVEGLSSYTTQVGWLGYPDDKLRNLCRKFLADGFTKFKIKVGRNLEDDKRRCRIIREEIGKECTLMMDANQVWDVESAIAWMKELAEFSPLWIEEPTSPDDILGHATIGVALRPLGIKIATGEQCQNRVMFKQFLQAGAMGYCQIDACRVGGVNENLAIILMAVKAGIPVVPHAGGVGLCELVQHLAIFDAVAVAGLHAERLVEFVDHLHEHFVDPVEIKAFSDGCRYMPPDRPGFSAEMKKESRSRYAFPSGQVWSDLTNG